MSARLRIFWLVYLLILVGPVGWSADQPSIRRQLVVDLLTTLLISFSYLKNNPVYLLSHFLCAFKRLYKLFYTTFRGESSRFMICNVISIKQIFTYLYFLFIFRFYQVRKSHTLVSILLFIKFLFRIAILRKYKNNGKPLLFSINIL